jgi:hypothetical protein
LVATAIGVNRLLIFYQTGPELSAPRTQVIFERLQILRWRLAMLLYAAYGVQYNLYQRGSTRR